MSRMCDILLILETALSNVAPVCFKLQDIKGCKWDFQGLGLPWQPFSRFFCFVLGVFYTPSTAFAFRCWKQESQLLLLATVQNAFDENRDGDFSTQAAFAKTDSFSSFSQTTVWHGGLHQALTHWREKKRQIQTSTDAPTFTIIYWPTWRSLSLVARLVSTLSVCVTVCFFCQRSV